MIFTCSELLLRKGENCSEVPDAKVSVEPNPEEAPCCWTEPAPAAAGSAEVIAPCSKVIYYYIYIFSYRET